MADGFYGTVPANWSEEQFMSAYGGANPDLWRFASIAPGYVDVLRAASQNPGLFSQPGALEGWLHGTPYWTTTSASKRNWDWLGVTDPAERNKQYQYIKENVNNVASRLGYRWASAEEENSFYMVAAMEGWDEQRTRTEIMKRWAVRELGGNAAVTYAQMPGEFGDIMTKVYQTALDYGVPITMQQAGENASHIVLGDASEESMTQGMRNWAKGFYAGNQTIVDAINQGFTVRQWAQPYQQLLSQELEVNPNTIDWSDDKWNTFINQYDANGVRRPLSLSEATVKLRNDPVYGFDQTYNGQQKSAQLTSSLAQMFGATG